MKKVFLSCLLLLSLFSFALADDLKEAYDRAYSYKITTQSYQNANFNWPLTRQAMAKMVVNLSKNVFNKKPDTSLPCNFSDINTATSDLIPYIKEACQLWLMWQDVKNFNPHWKLTKAQFWTLLSRMIFNPEEIAVTEPYYAWHLLALDGYWIMNKKDPEVIIKRSDVFITIKKAVDTFRLDPNVDYVQKKKDEQEKAQKELTDRRDSMKAWAINFTTTGLNITNSNGEKIVWTLYYPSKTWKLPLIIFSHGLGQTRSSWKTYAEYFAWKWIAVYAFDYRWWGPKSESDGTTTWMTVLTEVEDLKTVISEATNRSFVDSSNIVLMGISQWWLVSALVSAELLNKIKWDILFYPAFSIQDTVKGIYKSLNQVPATYNFLWQITLGKKYAEDIRNYDVYDKIKNDEKKILIVHWDRDLIVPFTAVQKADEIYKNSELHIMTWAEHWFSGKYFMDAVEYATKYLKDISILK